MNNLIVDTGPMSPAARRTCARAFRGLVRRRGLTVPKASTRYPGGNLADAPVTYDDGPADPTGIGKDTTPAPKGCPTCGHEHPAGAAHHPTEPDRYAEHPCGDGGPIHGFHDRNQCASANMRAFARKVKANREASIQHALNRQRANRNAVAGGRPPTAAPSGPQGVTPTPDAPESSPDRPGPAPETTPEPTPTPPEIAPPQVAPVTPPPSAPNAPATAGSVGGQSGPDRRGPLSLPHVAHAAQYYAARGIKVNPNGHESIKKYEGVNHHEVAAAYDPLSKTVQINHQSPYWHKPAEISKHDYNLGLASSAHPDHVIRHEEGHREHHRKMSFFNFLRHKFVKLKGNDKAIVEKQVSKYAATQPFEMVAEVYAGLRNGKRYSPEIMRLYRKFQGPSLSSSDAGAADQEYAARHPNHPPRGPIMYAREIEPERYAEHPCGDGGSIHGFHDENLCMELVRGHIHRTHPHVALTDQNSPHLHQINRAVNHYRANGLNVNPTAEAGLEKFYGGKHQHVVAAFLSRNRGDGGVDRDLAINQGNHYWTAPRHISKYNYESGHTSTPHIDHPIFHEEGHYRHSTKLGHKFQGFGATDPEFANHKVMIAKDVSRYAASNPKEFVAEVYAAMRTGKRYPRPIMDLYRQYHGPKIGAVNDKYLQDE